MGSAGREECERKYRLWVDHLSLCVDCSGADESGRADESRVADERGGGGGEAEAEAEAASAGGDGAGLGLPAPSLGVKVEVHAVHPVLDRFIFAARGWSPAPPLPATSNDCGVGEGRRRAVVDAWQAGRRLQKHERRGANKEWNDEQRAAHERLRRARESTVHVTLEPRRGGGGARLRLFHEVHEGRFVAFLGPRD